MTEPVRLPQGYRLYAYDEVESTNDIARSLAETGAAEAAVVVARSQSAGRGRHGRTWASPPGNVYTSVLLRPERDLAETAALSLVTGLALGEALHALGARPGRIRLKWPNDVLLDGAKVAGLLLESGGANHGGDRSWVVVGAGVNLVSAPEMTSFPATSLAAAGLGEVTPERALGAYLERLDVRYRAWQATGLDALRADWLACAFGHGDMVRLRLPDGELHGRFVDLTENGALLLEAPDGARHAVTAGEVIYGH